MAKENKSGIDWSDPEQVREYQRQRRERSKELRKAWVERNPEHAKELISKAFQKYYANNREKHLQYMRDYRQRNKEELNRKSRERNKRQKELDLGEQ